MNSTIESVKSHIAHHDFKAAVRKIVAQHPHKPSLGEAIHLKDEYLRLSQTTSLSFGGTALEKLVEVGGVGAHEYRLYCKFQGLLGSNGSLPLHFTEYALQRSLHEHDDTFREFIDLFNHRLLSLFYRASVQFDPIINHDRPKKNDYYLFLGALAGFGLPETHLSELPAEFRLRHTGWFGTKTKTPDGLISLINDYFDVPAAIVEYQGRWLELPDEARMRIESGCTGSQLRQSSWLGKRVWSIGQGFTVQLGPLKPDDFRSFQSGTKRAKELYELVRLYLGDEFDWDVELLVVEHEISGVKLNRKSKLGFDCWLQSSNKNVSQSTGIRLGRHVLKAAA